MNETKPLPPEDWVLDTNITMREFGLEGVVLAGLMTHAAARGDTTFSVMRIAHMTIRRVPMQVLDQFANSLGWQVLRVNRVTLVARSEGVCATIEASGTPERCAIVVELWADTAQHVDAALERILAEIRPYQITDVAFSLNWRFLDGKASVCRACTEERASEELLDEAYPALPGVHEFIGGYLEAPETVLVLQGSPGTGKTRLIRSILGAMSRRKGETAEVLYTGDSAVLESDEVFLEFITGDFRAFVVEDADHLLAPRSSGNQTLHRFLNIADGIASAHGKKIIFSTNLPNMRDIDEALVRPGRCFAHLYLAELQRAEAERLLDRLCEESPERRVGARAQLDLADRKAFSVAEVYSAFRRAGPQATPRTSQRQGIARAAERVAFGFN